MPRRITFELVYAPEVIEQLAVIERKYHRLIQTTIIEQLSYTPLNPTRNRKPLDQPAPFQATWEVRFGPENRFRVFYEVDTEEQVVHVLAIGVKEGNRLFFSGKEFEP